MNNSNKFREPLFMFRTVVLTISRVLRYPPNGFHEDFEGGNPMDQDMDGGDDGDDDDDDNGASPQKRRDEFPTKDESSDSHGGSSTGRNDPKENRIQRKQKSNERKWHLYLSTTVVVALAIAIIRYEYLRRKRGRLVPKKDAIYPGIFLHMSLSLSSSSLSLWYRNLLTISWRIVTKLSSSLQKRIGMKRDNVLSSNQKKVITSSSSSSLIEKTVPLSFLFRAMVDRKVERALLNASTCLFILRNDDDHKSSSASDSTSTSTSTTMKKKVWNRTTFPESQAMREKILLSLSEAGCDQIDPYEVASATTKPVWAYAGDAAVYASPFVYLWFVSRMLRSLSSSQHQDPWKLLRSNGSSSHQQRRQQQQHQRGHRVPSNVTTFDDVAGMSEVKQELVEVVECLLKRNRRGGKKNPLMLSSSSSSSLLRVDVPRGVLLYGPPGTGKTLLARAFAGEVGPRCAFVSCSGADFVEVLVGRGAARVRELFEHARAEARRLAFVPNRSTWWRQHRRQRQRQHRQQQQQAIQSNGADDHDHVQPSPPSAVVFIDELDALAKTRAGGGGFVGGGSDEREQTLNQLLVEMDGFRYGGNNDNADENETDHVNLVVLAATNRPDVLDPALLRPGRFDRHVHVGLPDAEGRRAIFEFYCRRRHVHDCNSSSSETLRDNDDVDVDAKALAEHALSEGMSGAQIRNVVNEAVFLALREVDDNDEHDVFVKQRHLLRALKKVRGTETVQTTTYHYRRK